MEKAYLSIDEASSYTGIKKSTLYAKVERREISYHRIGRLIKFTKNDLDAWMKAHRVESVDVKEEGRKILKNTRGANVDIDSLIKKTIAESRGTEYTLSHEESDRFKGLRKKASHGTL